MNTFKAIAIGATLFSSQAIAGSATVDIAPTAISAPTSGPHDWSGIYVGGLVSFDNGDRSYSSNVDYVYEADTNFGGFAGYNWQRGALVFGAEVAGTTGKLVSPGFSSSHDYFLDAKARVGYAVGNILIYASAGGSWSSFATSATYNISGFNYGVGVDYAISDHWFAGAEYMMRDMSGPRSNNPNLIATVTTQSIQLRIGYNF